MSHVQALNRSEISSDGYAREVVFSVFNSFSKHGGKNYQKTVDFAVDKIL